MKLMRWSTVLVGLTLAAQQAPTPPQTTELEAARKLDAANRGPFRQRAGDPAAVEMRIANLAAQLDRERLTFQEKGTLLFLVQGRRSPEEQALLDHKETVILEDRLSPAPSVAQFTRQTLDLMDGISRARTAALAHGRTVTDIVMVGLTGSRPGELLTKLPVRKGETLSFDSVQALAVAVKSYDADLAVKMVLVEKSGAVITISAPVE